MATVTTAAPTKVGLITRINTTWHRPAMWLFFGIVIAHWAEHLVQAAQIWVLGWERTDSRGVIGQWFPAVVTEEWLHFGYAVVMLAGLVLLLPGMSGRARFWWKVALAVQVWHFVEHFLLWVQAATDTPFFGQAAPTSVVQLALPRVELHLFYNLAVFAPMLVAMYFHIVPPLSELQTPSSCSCRLAKLSATT